MNRSKYYNYIDEKLAVLSLRIKQRSKANLLDLNIYSETFFAELLNIVFKWDLKNFNVVKQNTEGIDLIDEKNKILAQVSSTCTKQKIEDSLSKGIFKQYPDYQFKFILITGEADKLRKMTFKNPNMATFEPKADIYDIKSILDRILDMLIEEQRDVFSFIKEELGDDFDAVKFDSNLTSIINILSRENLVSIKESPNVNAFEIERKIAFNDLVSARRTIDENIIFYRKLDEKYSEFDKQGVNKSLSVFSTIRNQYDKLLDNSTTANELFFAIIDSVIEVVMKSRNYVEIPYEELEMCVSIIVVDAFIRCKIFENPEDITMLLPDNIHPELSIYYNSSFVLKELKTNNNQSILSLYKQIKAKSDMSFSTYILCLDWLYLIDAAKTNESGGVELCTLRD